MKRVRAEFVHEDEWYSFERSARQPGVRVLASLDESSYTPREIFRDLSMGDHPVLEGAVAWAAGPTGDCPPPR